MSRWTRSITVCTTLALTLWAAGPAWAQQTRQAPPVRASWAVFIALGAVLILVIFFTAVTGRGVGPRPSLGQPPADGVDHSPGHGDHTDHTAVDAMPTETGAQEPSPAEEAVEAPSKVEATEDPRPDVP